jgi:putative sterol carrier protein
MVLALRTMFDPRAAEGLEASYKLQLDEDHFRVVVGEGRFEVVRGDADRPDASIETDPGTLRALVFHGRPLAEALRSGDVKVEGDESAAARFLSLFALPDPVAPAVGA